MSVDPHVAKRRRTGLKPVRKYAIQAVLPDSFVQFTNHGIGRFMPRSFHPIAALLCLVALLDLVSIGLSQEAIKTADDAQPVSDEQAAKDAVIAQTLLRLENFDLDTRPKVKDALLRYLRANRDVDDFLTLVKKYQLAEMSDVLMSQAAKFSDDTRGVEAARLLLEFKPLNEVKQFLASPRTDASPIDRAELLLALGRTESSSIQQLALEYAGNPATDSALHRAAIRTVGRSESGKQALLQLLQDGRFEKDLHVVLGSVLLSSGDGRVRTAATKLLDLPQAAGNQALPSVDQLAAMRGDVTKGHEVFHTVGTCIKCHQDGNEGKQVGPGLSEIGDKLAREAMYVSILDPSGAISFGFETYNVLLDDGRSLTGIKVSETDEHVTVKNAEGIEQSIPRDQIDEIAVQKVSLMPSGLAQSLTTQQLVDLVEYLMSLKKK